MSFIAVFQGVSVFPPLPAAHDPLHVLADPAKRPRVPVDADCQLAVTTGSIARAYGAGTLPFAPHLRRA